MCDTKKLLEIEETLIAQDKTLMEVSAKLDELSLQLHSIVPNSDFVGHRIYHECVIAAARRKEALQNAIIEKTLTGLLWLALSAAGIAIWQYLKTQIKS